ncbi:MAG: alpha/beta fold hydrolase [Chloroflexi bacterium]|nr:alpha/beta fold hydrolase [Chloroflexota bacterium]MBP8059323.1 alpha/beta fold hydrolase [Chloroflexota bacterium]
MSDHVFQGDTVTVFSRVLRLFLFLIGLLAGLVVTIAFFFARRLVKPPRERLWASPADLGMVYEPVHFPARGGIRLSGWFVPAQGATGSPRPTVILVHGFPWNRLGAAADDPISRLEGSSPVNLLRLAFSLYQAGYHVLMFDLRNHGESAAASPATIGVQETDDLLGALDFLSGRADVDKARIGAIGFSMGANTILYTLPHTEQIKAVIAVQPTSVDVFTRGYAWHLLGPLSKVVLPLVQLFYHWAGGLRFEQIKPAYAAAHSGRTPILYVQGTGDAWGSVDDVLDMVAVTPYAVDPLIVETQHRYHGYQYIINRPEIALSFFQDYL